MRLLRASVLKLGLRPASYRTFLVLAGILVFLYLSIGLSANTLTDPSMRDTLRSMLEFPGAGATLGGIVLIFGGMAGAAYAGSIAASEWSWNTFRVALTRGESRVRYVILLFVGIGLLVLAAWVLLCCLGLGLVYLAAAFGGFVPGSPLEGENPGRLLAVVVAGGWAVLSTVAIGFCFGFITRSPVAGIAVVAGLYFAEQLGALVVPVDVLRLAPITSASALVAQAGQAAFDGALAMPLLVTTCYVLLAVGVTAVVAHRAQVA